MNATAYGGKSSERDTRLRSAVEENSRDLLAYFVRRVSPVDDAADLVSETMLAGWRRIRDLPTDKRESRMWLFGVARNVLTNYQRGKRRSDALAERLRLELAVGQVSQDDLSVDDRTEIRVAVAQLAPKLHEVIALVHWEGFTLSEAAKIMNVPASTVRGRYSTARSALRDLLADAQTLADGRLP